MDWFESPFKLFESLMNSNHPYRDSNPSWKKSEEIKVRIQITYTAIRIPHEEQGKAIRIPSQIEAKDWKSDRAI